MKQNRNFAKPDENSRPIYAPTVLRVVTHHHDEGVDPETGEHWERDWDTYETKTNPTDADRAAMGYLPLSPNYPADPPEGKHWERTDKIEPNGNGYKWVYVLVDNPPPPPRRWTRLAIETALAQADALDAMDAYLAQVVVVGKLTAARAFSRCDYIEEGFGGDEAWNALLDGAAQALGKTREEIDAFLAAIPTEGGAA